jgi:hypothetical protein
VKAPKRARPHKATLREQLADAETTLSLERADHRVSRVSLERERDQWKATAERVGKDYERLQEIIARVRFAVELEMR